MMADLGDLETAIGYRFNDRSWLDEALRHRSAAASSSDNSNERLEFLGDRVLGLVIADMLLTHFPDESESALAPRLTALVRSETLAKVAKSWGVDAHLAVADTKNDTALTPNVLADACEAIIGAVYRDGSLADAARLIERHFETRMANAEAPPIDAKTTLQQLALGKGLDLPVYEVTEVSGPDHAPHFKMSVEVDGLGIAAGEGPSKRAAAQKAAQALLDEFTDG